MLAKCKYLFVISIFLGLASIFFAKPAYADAGSGGGAGNTGAAAAVGYGVDCYESTYYCPQWIKAPISVFERAWSQARSGSSDWDILNYSNRAYSQTAHDTCVNTRLNTSGYVYFSGYFGYLRPDLDHIRLFNSTNLYTKESHGNSMTVYGGGGISIGDFFGEQFQYADGTWSSVGKLMNDVIAITPGVSNEHDLAFFCMGMIPQEPKYYSQSTIGIDGDFKWTTISQSETVTVKKTIDLNQTNKVKLFFGHDSFSTLYSEKPMEWGIRRVVNGQLRDFSDNSDGQHDYAFATRVRDGESGTSNKYTEAYREYYRANPHSDTDGVGYTYTKAQFSDVTFLDSAVGKTFTFCEWFQLHWVTDTRVCAEIEVIRGSSDYFSSSTVFLDGNSSTTGITSSGSASVAKQLTIPSGSSKITASLVFAHNGYTKERSESSSNFSIARTLNDNSSAFSLGSGFSFSPFGALKPSAGAIASFTYLEDNYYTFGLRTNVYSGKRYISLENYKVTFTKAGTYKICEKYTVADSANTEVCANITVKSDNPPPNNDTCPIPTPSGTSTISSGVSKTNSAVIDLDIPKYSSWGSNLKQVYSKPYDYVQYDHCVFTGAQSVKKSTMHGGHPDSFTPTSNGTREKLVATNNNMTVSGFNFWSSRTFSYTLGEVAVHNAQSDKYRVKTTDVGKDLTQTSSANNGSASSWSDHEGWNWTEWIFETNGSYCGYDVSTEVDEDGKTHETKTARSCNVPYKRYTSHDGPYYVGSATGSSAGVSATSSVPYNFTTSLWADFRDSTGKLYAGESVSIRNEVTVHQKYNSVTEGDYATWTPDYTVTKILTFTYDKSQNASGSYDTSGGEVSGGTGTSSSSLVSAAFSGASFYSDNSRTGRLNSGGSFTTHTETVSSLDRTYNVPDYEAGTLFCTAIAVFPSKSADNEIGNDNGKWNVSNASCRSIAKKPSVQIWGNNFYTSGNVTTSLSRKKTTQEGTFGSWTEFGLTAKGVVRQMASGASLGYRTAYSSPTTNGGGAYGVDFCDSLVPQTIANKSCLSTVVGKPANAAGVSDVQADVSLGSRIISRFATVKNYPANNCSNLNLNDDRFETRDGSGFTYNYSYCNGNATITRAPNLGMGTTFIVYAKNSINIDWNLNYSAQNYKGYSQVPQYVIISESGDINISQNVTNIDAWLIAPNGTVNTCREHSTTHTGTGTFSNLNPATDCTNQLKVNGPVVARNLILGRNYGANSGNASILPAELFDSTAESYLWAYAQANSHAQIYTTYVRELAPRY